MKRCVFVLVLLSTVFKCSLDGFDAQRNNSFDAGSGAFSVNQPPESLHVYTPTWEEFEYSDSAGKVRLHFKAYDPNEYRDTITYSVYAGPTGASLQHYYEGKDTSCLVGRARVGSRLHYKIIAKDRFDSTLVLIDSIRLPVGLPPRPPTGLYLYTSQTSISLSWSCVPGVTEYRVYRADSLGAPFALIATVMGCEYSYGSSVSFEDARVDYRDKLYRVASRNANGEAIGKDTVCGHKYYSLGSNYYPSASSGYPEYIRISWSESYSSPSYYVLYRSKSSSGNYLPIAKIANKGSYSFSYNDSVPDSDLYYYKIAAFDNQGRGSSLSSYASGRTAGLPAPSYVNATSGLNGYIDLEWGDVSSAAGYYIYRSTSPYGQYVKIDSTTSTSYRDYPLSTSTFYYSVSAYSLQKKEGEKSYYASGYRMGLVGPSVNASLGTYPNKIVLWWNAISGVDGYVVQKVSNGTFVTLDSITRTSFTDSVGLKSDSSYVYRVIAYKGKDAGSSENVAGRTMWAPFLSSVSDYAGAIELSINCVSYATGYHIYRAAAIDSPFVRIGSTTSCSFRDTVRGCFSSYVYQVSAYNLYGESPRSASRVGSLTTLGAPQALTATERINAVTLRWRPVPCAQSYIVLRSGTGSAVPIATLADTTFTDSLFDNIRYTYSVQSVRGTTKSLVSASVTSGRAMVPYSPSLFSVAGLSNVIYLSWSYSYTPSPTGFKVYRSTSSSGPFTLLDSVSGYNYYDSVPLSPTTYYYRVSAYNLAGEGAYAASQSVKLQGPNPPARIEASNSYPHHVRVTWSKVANVTGYRVSRSLNSSSGFEILAAPSDTLYLDTSALLGTSYYYKVAAQNPVGEGVLGTWAMGRRLTPPTISHVLGSVAHIEIVFSATDPVTRYYVYRSTNSSGPFSKIDSTNATRYADTVQSDSMYFYRVASMYSGQVSVQSASSVGARRQRPAAPLLVSASDGAHVDTVLITWSGTIGAESYSIYRSIDSAMTNPVFCGTSNVTSFKDPLTSDSAYYYAVKARNPAGESVMSYVRDRGYRQPQAVPVAPQNVIASQNISEYVFVRWTKPSVGYSGFKIYRATSQLGSYTLIDSTLGQTYSDPVPASYPTRYWYAISAYNEVGEGPKSEGVEGYRN